MEKIGKSIYIKKEILLFVEYLASFENTKSKIYLENYLHDLKNKYPNEYIQYQKLKKNDK